LESLKERDHTKDVDYDILLQYTVEISYNVITGPDILCRYNRGA